MKKHGNSWGEKALLFGLLIIAAFFTTLLLLTTGCKEAEKIIVYKTDSVYIKTDTSTNERDTVVIFKERSGALDLIFGDNMEIREKSKLNNGIEIRYKYIKADNTLSITATAKQEEIKLKLKDRLIKLVKEKYSKINTVETKEVEKPLTWWQRTRMILGWVLIGMCVLLGLYIYAKKGD